MKNKIIMISIQVVILIVAIGATWWFTSGSKPDEAAAPAGKPGAVEEKKLAPPEYISMAPSFVVNLQGERPMRFLMVEVELMTRNKDTVDLVKEYLPSLRHELNMLFSSQTRESIATVEAREELQKSALKKVNALLKKETGKGKVDEVYFTKFVMQ